MKRLLVILILIFFVGSVTTQALAEGALKILKADVSRYPETRLHLGLTASERAVGFEVRENGHRVKNLKIDSKTYKQPVGVTLLMDVSGSMQGKPLEDAKAAAKLFVQRAHGSDRIAIVAFSTTVSRVADFTSDKNQLNQAIASLQAGGETAVYDALRDSMSAAQNQPIKHQSVILLSDGADTASRYSADLAGELASKLKIPVSAIALQSPDFNPDPIENIAKRSGGRLLTAPSSAGLLGLYDGLASELHNRYQLAYTSTARGPKARIEVIANVAGHALRAATVISTPSLAQPARGSASQPVRISKRLSGFAIPWVAAGFGFLAVFLLTLALSNLILPSRNTLSNQLKYYDQLKGRKQTDKKQPLLEQTHQSLVEIIKRLSIRYDFTAYAQSKLAAAGLPVNPYEYMMIHLLGVIAISTLAVLFSGSMPTAIFVVAVGVVTPLLVVEAMVLRRQSTFNDQLPDTLDMLAASMRAGYGLQQAVVAAGRETREPTASELKRVSSQVQMGMLLEDALSRMAERVGSAPFRWVVLAIAIHREAGGNLAEILDNLANSLRQRETMRRQIKALTAEGNLSAIILIALPFLEAFVLVWLNPGYMSLLVTTLPGVLMLMVALGLMGVGALWLRRIAQIEY